MNDFEFYKNKFERELGRRNDLDNGINNPVAGITIVIVLVSYILSNNDFKDCSNFDICVLVIVGLIVLTSLISLFYVFCSNNNFFKGFEYKNFGLLSEYRIFQKNIEIYNKQIDNESLKKNFESEIIDKIIALSDNHTIINDTRGYHLYKSKQLLILSFILTIIGLLIITINNYII